MPRNAFDVQHQQWKKLLEAVGEGKAELAGVAPFSAALESAHAKVVHARKQRDELYAASQEATRSMYQALEECREAGISLRHYIKSVLGSRAEKLSRYGIKPRKSRRASRRLPGRCELPS
jgi:hypothetical protein